jgi:hypothetical protein
MPAMFTLEELSRQTAACNNGSLSIQQFVDWFEGNCAGAYETESLRDATVAVDAALSEYHYDEIDEEVLKKQLAVAVCPVIQMPPGPRISTSALSVRI